MVGESCVPKGTRDPDALNLVGDRRDGPPLRQVVPPGGVRFEAECRKPWLKPYDKIKLLSDVTPARVELLARNRWEWSQMGVVTVGNPEDLVSAVSRLQLKGMDVLALIGWITAQSAGGVFAQRAGPRRRSCADSPVRLGSGCRGCLCSRGVSTSPADERSWRPFEP